MPSIPWFSSSNYDPQPFPLRWVRCSSNLHVKLAGIVGPRKPLPCPPHTHQRAVACGSGAKVRSFRGLDRQSAVIDYRLVARLWRSCRLTGLRCCSTGVILGSLALIVSLGGILSAGKSALPPPFPEPNPPLFSLVGRINPGVGWAILMDEGPPLCLLCNDV